MSWRGKNLPRGLFQSTPGIKTGRLSLSSGVVITGNVFQSTPGIKTGRLAIVDGDPPIVTGFNPRPALKPGDSELLSTRYTCKLVSIHARH